MKKCDCQKRPVFDTSQTALFEFHTSNTPGTGYIHHIPGEIEFHVYNYSGKAGKFIVYWEEEK